jgi:hypothetical protein
MLNHPGIQRLLSHIPVGASYCSFWCQTGILHLMILQMFTMQELQGWRLPPRFQRKSSPSKESKCATESDFLPADPKKEMHEAIRVMLKKKWRPQEVRDARNMQ